MKKAIFLSLTFIAMVSCSNRLSRQAEQELRPQFKQLITSWLDQKNGYEVKVKSEKLEEYLNARREAYKKANGEYEKPEAPPKWKEYRVDVKEIRREGESLIATTEVFQALGELPEAEYEAGEYLYKFTISKNKGKYQIGEVYEKFAASAPWRSLSDKIKTMQEQD